jgi:hypothetical protein
MLLDLLRGLPDQCEHQVRTRALTDGALTSVLFNQRINSWVIYNLK